MTGTDSTSHQPLLTFPCEFPIKAMGNCSDDFQALIVDIVRMHAPDIDATQARSTPSRNGRFLSVTITIQASSQKQLDAIYHDLVRHDRVIMAL